MGLKPALHFILGSFSNGVRIDLGIDLHFIAGDSWFIVIVMHS